MRFPGKTTAGRETRGVVRCGIISHVSGLTAIPITTSPATIAILLLVLTH